MKQHTGQMTSLNNKRVSQPREDEAVYRSTRSKCRVISKTNSLKQSPQKKLETAPTESSDLYYEDENIDHFLVQDNFVDNSDYRGSPRPLSQIKFRLDYTINSLSHFLQNDYFNFKVESKVNEDSQDSEGDFESKLLFLLIYFNILQGTENDDIPELPKKNCRGANKTKPKIRIEQSCIPTITREISNFLDEYEPFKDEVIQEIENLGVEYEDLQNHLETTFKGKIGGQAKVGTYTKLYEVIGDESIYRRADDGNEKTRLKKAFWITFQKFFNHFEEWVNNFYRSGTNRCRTTKRQTRDHELKKKTYIERKSQIQRGFKNPNQHMRQKRR